MHVKKLLHHYQIWWSERLVRSVKAKAIVTVRDRPRSYCGKKAFKPPDIRRSLSAICGEKELARNIVSNWVRSFNSRQETAQVAAHECYRKPLKEWFHKAIRKLPRAGSDVAPGRKTC
jgi:hypothetical protein